MMKYYVACMLVLCVSSGLMAQDKKSPPSNYKHLKPLEFIVGDWQAEVPTDKDVPGLFKKGEMLTLKLSVRWVGRVCSNREEESDGSQRRSCGGRLQS